MEAGTYSSEEFEKFYTGLNDKQIEKIASFLINTLSSMDDEEKAKIIGYIYKYRVQRQIDDDLMFRLCAIVNRSYLNDLKSLPEYCNVKTTNSYIADNLFSLGLLANCGIDGGSADESSGGTIYQLNGIGENLFKILQKEHWI